MPAASIGRLIALVILTCVVSASGLLLPSRQPSELNTSAPARWELDPEELPGPADTSFVALVQEIGCSSGRPIDDKLLPPVIEYGEHEIVVRLYLEPLQGDAFECPLRAPTRFTIALHQPIGNRTLVDGSGRVDPAGP